MRRVLYVILTFLMLGGGITVAVAWGCERFAKVRMIDTMLIARERRAEFARAERDLQISNQSWVTDAFTSTGTEIIRTSQDGKQAEVRRAGWPCQSLFCVVEYRSGGSSNWSREIHGGLLIGGYNFICRDVPGLGLSMGMQGIERVLPLRPIWLGLALNTLFWAAVLWILRMFPRGVRRAVWAMRHRCVHCGYPVGVSAVCTECGQSISRRHLRRNDSLPASLKQ